MEAIVKVSECVVYVCISMHVWVVNIHVCRNQRIATDHGPSVSSDFDWKQAL